MQIEMNLDKTYNGFELDSAAIKFQSIDRRSIKLPYTGPLPANFEGAGNPHIFMRVTPCDVRVVLAAKKSGKEVRAIIAATPEEIDNILFSFFFKDKGENTYHTNFSNGLEAYWLGSYQAEYVLWRKITLEGCAGDIALNLPDDKRVGLLKFLQLMERQRTEGEPA